MLKNKVIKPSINSYTFNIVIVGKKDEVDEEIDRMCINFASLNEVIEKDSRLIPIIKKYLLFFHEVKWIIVLDLAFTYWQILLIKRSQKFITFLIAFELYQF